MAGTATPVKTAAKAPAAKPAAKRTVMSPEQRIAKLEEQLAAAKARAEKKQTKEADDLKARRAKLQAQVDERMAKIHDIDVELVRLGFGGGTIVDVSGTVDVSSDELPL